MLKFSANTQYHKTGNLQAHFYDAFILNLGWTKSQKGTCRREYQTHHSCYEIYQRAATVALY
jgi:hypothetical protein